MPTPDSPAGILLAGLTAHKMPVAEFATVAGREGIRATSKSSMNGYFSDTAAMPRDVEAACLRVWREIEALCEEAKPLVLDLRDGQQVHAWVKARRQDELRVLIGKFPREQSPLVRGFLSALGGQ